MLIGIIFGPIAAKFLDAKEWGLKEEGQVSEITLVSLSNTTQGEKNSLTHNRASPAW